MARSGAVFQIGLPTVDRCDPHMHPITASSFVKRQRHFAKLKLLSTVDLLSAVGIDGKAKTATDRGSL
jgi:hypothetical protein